MQHTLENLAGGKTEMPFQMNRPLIPVDQYARTHKLSGPAIREYHKMGIIQIRRFKNQAFVIDTPQSQNPPVLEKQILTPQKKNLQQVKPKQIPKPAPKPEPQVQKTQTLNRQPVGAEEKKALIMEPAALPRVSTALCWKFAAVISIVTMLGAAVAGVGVFSNQKYEINSLSQANVDLLSRINQLNQNPTSVETQVALKSSQAKVLKLQQEITNYQARINDLEKQLDFANQRLKYIETRNSNAEQHFQMQKTKLLNQLNDLSSK